MPIASVYSKSIGINNKIAAHRLPYDESTGVSAFEYADNVLVDRTGEVVSRRGTKVIDSDAFHSLFSLGDFGLVCKDRASDTAIYQVNVAATGDVILSGLFSGFTQGAKFDFCKVNGTVLYTNGYGHGAISESLQLSGWPTNAWPDDATFADFADVPVPDHLGYNAGRVYFSVGNVIHYTEYGQPGIYDPATNGERFNSKILLIAPAVDGVYVSDEEAIYFLAGLDPHGWKMRKVVDYPALEWGLLKKAVNPSHLGIESNIPSILIATKNGPLVCMASGQVVNLVDKAITLPDCKGGGSIMMVDETLIIQSTE